MKGWVAQGREIFDQDEGGNIAELEVGKFTLSLEQFSSKKVMTGLNSWTYVKVRETFDMKNISPVGKFPDQTCPGLRHKKAHKKPKTLQLISMSSKN